MPAARAPSQRQQLAMMDLMLILSLGLAAAEGAAVHSFRLEHWRCGELGRAGSVCDAMAAGGGGAAGSREDLGGEISAAASEALRAMMPRTAAPDVDRPGPEMLSSAPLAEVDAPLRNNFNMLYTVVARVGSPAVPVRLIVDTGSSDLWVKASSAAAPFGLQYGGAVYDWRKSSTASPVPGDPVTILYGEGRVEGREVRDRFCLESLCIDNQSFVFADLVAGIPDQWLFDGILGLGYPKLAAIDSRPSGGATVVQSLNTTFRHLAVGFSLGNTALGLSGGHLRVGELVDLHREARVSLGPGVTLPLYGIDRRPLFWLVRASVTVEPGRDSVSPLRGGRPEPDLLAATGKGTTTARMAILDSGTSLIAAPTADYLRLVGALTGGSPDAQQKCTTTLLSAYGQLTCMCDATLNPLLFTLAGFDGRQIQVKLHAADLMQVVGFSTGGGPGICRLAVMPTPGGAPIWILGDVFLRHVYAVHDVRGHRVQLFPDSGSQAATVLQTAAVVRRPSEIVVASAGIAVLGGVAVAFALRACRGRQRELLDIYSAM
mmetsp:Transcript_27706/g.78615  ORF Transcript_27706/g.78615 Transcript_27706/m.78615 type:complete len:546 (-) Transcript_27706:47-1684(-)